MLNADGVGSGIIETESRSTTPVCENIILPRTWVRRCPDCGKEIVYYHSSNFYYARSQGRLCSHCCIKGNKSSFYGGKQWTKEKRLWWSKNCPTLFTSKNNPTSNPLVREKISNSCKGRLAFIETRVKLSKAKRGINNPHYGIPASQGSGNGWANWYKGFHFRSLRELQYYITEIDERGVSCESAQGKKFRIPYKDYNGVDRTYKPDFFVNNHLLVEIKPKKLWNTKEVIAKKDAAEKFCDKVGYEYKLADVEPNSSLLKEKYLKGEIRFVEKYIERFEKYAGITK